jgi:hypothetical protein
MLNAQMPGLKPHQDRLTALISATLKEEGVKVPLGSSHLTSLLPPQGPPIKPTTGPITLLPKIIDVATTNLFSYDRFLKDFDDPEAARIWERMGFTNFTFASPAAQTYSELYITALFGGRVSSDPASTFISKDYLDRTGLKKDFERKLGIKFTPRPGTSTVLNMAPNFTRSLLGEGFVNNLLRHTKEISVRNAEPRETALPSYYTRLIEQFPKLDEAGQEIATRYATDLAQLLLCRTISTEDGRVRTTLPEQPSETARERFSHGILASFKIAFPFLDIQDRAPGQDLIHYSERPTAGQNPAARGYRSELTLSLEQTLLLQAKRVLQSTTISPATLSFASRRAFDIDDYRAQVDMGRMPAKE